MAYKVELNRQDINDICNGLVCYISKIMRVKKPGSYSAQKLEERYKRLYKFFEVLKKGEGN